jgi:aminoglycoside phosphotransferase
VSRRLTARVAVIFVMSFSAVSARAAPDADLSKELLSVIASQQLACGKIVTINTQADRDYLVECQDGSNYQINADPQGKLVAHLLGHRPH